jgi:methionine-S-sulfoxide reductase
MQKAILALGCFWEPEEKFRKIKGITSTEVGYCGGISPNVTYEEVCSGSTNHAEVVKIEFNENTITYEDIIRLFFDSHDATQLNGQGINIGANYRSEIFYTSEDQKKWQKKFSTNRMKNSKEC